MYFGVSTVSTRSNRKRLSENRIGITSKSQVGGMEYYVTVNFFDDTADPCEVFIKIAKEGSTVSGLMDALAITISIALQHGVEWSVLGQQYLGTIFSPRDDKASSLVDSVAKTIDDTVSLRKEILK